MAPEPIDDDDLRTVHDASYVDMVKAASDPARRPSEGELQRFGLATSDNPVFARMHELVRGVVASTVTAVDLVATGRARRAGSGAAGAPAATAPVSSASGKRPGEIFLWIAFGLAIAGTLAMLFLIKAPVDDRGERIPGGPNAFGGLTVAEIARAQNSVERQPGEVREQVLDPRRDRRVRIAIARLRRRRRVARRLGGARGLRGGGLRVQRRGGGRGRSREQADRAAPADGAAGHGVMAAARRPHTHVRSSTTSVTDCRSAEFAPTMISNSPGSTTRSIRLSHIAKCEGSSVNVTTRDSPGESVTPERPCC